MNSQRDLQILVKSKIQFTTADGDFEGVVRLVCPVTKKIIIEQLFFLPKKLFIGVLHFNISEILSYKLISQSQSNIRQQLFNRMHTKINNELSSEIGTVSEAIPKEERYVLKLPQWPNVILPTDSVILDCINEHFHQAIAHIQQQSNIGVHLSGPSIGRDGILSWLSITTPNCIFLFDIQILKEKAFHEGGLKDVFQNPRIEKILHDCRNASDCLYHKFGTKLINVFDTQVADLFVTMQSNKKGTTPQKVNTLNTCLTKYLDLPNLFHPKIKARSYIENILHYSLRPLKNEARDLLIKSSVYLRLLKQRLNKLMLNPFHRAVDIYLQVVQGASDQEILLEPTTEDDVPLQLIMGGLQTVHFRNTMLDLFSENMAKNTNENYSSLYKNNSGKDITMDTCNSSGFSRLLYQNDVDLASRRTSHNTENFNKSREGSKFNEIKNYTLDNDDSTDVCKLPQVTRRTHHEIIGTSRDNIKLSTVNLGECSGIDKSLPQTDINVTSKYENPKVLGYSYTEDINKSSSDMSYTQHSNDDSSNHTREIRVSEEKFRISHLKFNKDSICQTKQAYNGDNNPESKINTNNAKSASIESTPLSRNSFFNEKKKSKGLPNLEGDPYAKLREAFSAQNDTNDERKKGLKFFPAGMANIS